MIAPLPLTEYLNLSSAAHKCPDATSREKVRRWIIVGVVRRDGERIFLKATRVGGRYYTTMRWLEEFFADGSVAVAPEPKQLSIADQHRRADRRLKAMGA